LQVTTLFDLEEKIMAANCIQQTREGNVVLHRLVLQIGNAPKGSTTPESVRAAWYATRSFPARGYVSHLENYFARS
jgi:hypothetical protein